MAFRGSGRGRGRGRGPSERIAKHLPYENFPEDVTLPSLSNVAFTDEIKSLLRWSTKLEDFWRGSCYHLQEEVSKSKSQDTEVERYSVKRHRAHAKREALAHYLKLTPSNFPSELIHGSKRVQHENKKLRWDRNSDDSKLDLFAKLEEKDQGRDDEKPEKKGENEDEDEAQEEEEEESSDEDDYNQNIDFDDDEDDMNMEEGEEEDAYD